MRRAWLRRQLRRCIIDWSRIPAFAKLVALEPTAIASIVRQGSFGSAWHAIELNSTIITRSLVPIKDLSRQMDYALAIVENLRATGSDLDRDPSFTNSYARELAVLPFDGDPI